MKRGFIEIYDSILPKELSDNIENLILKDQVVNLVYTPNITDPNSSIQIPGFGNNFYDPVNNKFEPYSYAFFEIVYRLGNYLNLFIAQIYKARVFIHLPSPTPGQDEIHVDMPENHYVCLYYVNDSEGDTIIFDNNRKEIQRITPKKGRIVFFDGSLEHCSTRPSTKTRAVLNFNFIATKLG